MKTYQELKDRQHPICNTVGCQRVANWVHEGGIGASCDYHKNEWYTIEIDKLAKLLLIGQEV